MRALFIFITAGLLTLPSCKPDEESTFGLIECGIDFDTSVKYIAIGDEWSSGIYLDGAKPWPEFVKAGIEEVVEYELLDFAMLGSDGVNSDQLFVDLKNDDSRECHNTITLMVGMQDMLAGRTPEQFRTSYRNLLTECRAITRTAPADTANIACMGLPNVSVAPGLPATAGTPDEVATRILAFNTVIAEECQTAKVRYADIYEISTSLYTNGFFADEDGLHPDSTQHDVWGNTILEAISAGL